MSYLLNNQQKVNEIIFANRNKRYGAYAIRSSYGATLFKSLLFIFFGFGSIMYTAYYFSKGPDMPSQNNLPPFKLKDSVYEITFELPKPDEPQASEEKPQQPQSSASSAVGTQVVDTAETVSTHSVNIENPFSSTGNGTVALSEPTNTGGGNGTESTGKGTNTTTETVHIWVDTEPEFEGGLKALYKFLGSKLKYPERASEVGKQGIVYVCFVVDQKGKVGNLTLQNTQGYGLDEEALRVVAMIPDFKSPGMMDGKPVKVYYQVPIKFSLAK